MQVFGGSGHRRPILITRASSDRMALVIIGDPLRANK